MVAANPRSYAERAAAAGWREPAAPSTQEPDAIAEIRETIELAFLVAIQHLPPRQRAALILRDVLGWPAAQVAEQLSSSVASVNSALQRARATLWEHLPERRLDWSAQRPTEREREVLRRSPDAHRFRPRYMDAVQRADLDAMAELLAEDVRATMPPYRLWMSGRTSALAALAASWDPALPGYVGRMVMLPTGANTQPAAAAYVLRPGDAAYRPFAIVVLRVDGHRIAELTAFHDPGLFPAFGLPTELPARYPAVDR